ncbi:MAG: FkbM family methyltransferase [Fretibacterium sp.]|nr:FkbM family methyltransferase [Fretibacterium sp.]
MKKVLLWGAGSFGPAVYEEVKSEMNVLGFLDNDSSLWGTKVWGLPVLGGVDICKKLEYDEILICSRASRYAIRRQLLEAGIKLSKIKDAKIMPGSFLLIENPELGKEILLSFAEEREDIILYHMLHNVKDPVYWIDVGANHPVEGSVTKFFSDRGGWGINIEPQDVLIGELYADRPRDINLSVGISNEPGELRLYGSWGRASFDPNGPGPGYAGDGIVVPVVTLAEVCKKYVPSHQDIHFLKIDVEGWEKQCLEGMNFKEFRPWIVCAEATLPGTHIPNYDWEPILGKQGYILAGTSGVNRYYVAQERKGKAPFIEEFCDAEELDSHYNIIAYAKYRDMLTLEETLSRRALSRKDKIFWALRLR